ncbi:MAG: hypothetical protein AB7J34_09005 [Limisphaerales bacterium]
MPLLPFWQKQPDMLLNLTVEQMLAIAGDGKLRDGSPCSHELREVLSEVPSSFLIASARYCLDHAFDESGLVLQDIINEIGGRLEFKVDHGLYRGRKNKVGYDGIWKAAGCRDVIVEVKTTDYINIPLQKLFDYRRSLIKEGKVDEDACVLIVLGREDAGSLEDQVRGSRHGWDTRLITVDGLIKLLVVKEKADQEETIQKIRTLLQPMETTKLDSIIDIVFSTANDVEDAVESQSDNSPAADDTKPTSKQRRTPSEQLEAKRTAAAEAYGKTRGIRFVKQRRTLFRSVEGDERLCVVVSKNYGVASQGYWYAYHPHWDEFLKQGKSAHLMLVCMNLNVAFAIPYDTFSPLISKLNKTESDGRRYWHIVLNQTSEGELVINLTAVGEKIPLKPYEVSIA